jgi:hypothetical protein
MLRGRYLVRNASFSARNSINVVLESDRERNIFFCVLLFNLLVSYMFVEKSRTEKFNFNL